MSANNKELETISLCDMVDDLVHDESKINEDQNNVNLSLDDSNQPFACNRHSEPHLNMVFENLETARGYYNAPFALRFFFFLIFCFKTSYEPEMYPNSIYSNVQSILKTLVHHYQTN
ncbi:hypothetical protein CFP56_000331 [Quercus suber]|uniref:Uncharacterized protein n=1 Tax=Quercus suber TaxID=58331 RepID=A0AAW0M7W6_QUESU